MPGASKSISISAATYAKLKAYCELHNVSMSSVVRKGVQEILDAQPEDLLEAQPPVAGGQP